VVSGRIRTATAMAFRNQLRRPLVPILLVLVPAVIVIWSVAITQADPRRIELPGGLWAITTMKALHGPEMAKFTVAFVAALLGVFVMRSALQGDRRLVVAGYRAGEAIAARLTVVATAVVVVVAVAAAVIAVNFDPASWPPVVAALILVGLIYAAIGVLAGALLDKLAATYLILPRHERPQRRADADVPRDPGALRLAVSRLRTDAGHARGRLLGNLQRRRRPLARARLGGRTRDRGGLRPAPAARRANHTGPTDRLRGIFTPTRDPEPMRRERSTK
jgi:hypothetical protein